MKGTETPDCRNCLAHAQIKQVLVLEPAKHQATKEIQAKKKKKNTSHKDWHEKKRLKLFIKSSPTTNTVSRWYLSLSPMLESVSEFALLRPIACTV